jgi:D-alanine-D-alanine ligase
MRICILNDPLWGESFNPEIYLENHTCKKIHVYHNKSYEIIKKVSKDFDVFLNFCDASIVEKRPGIDVVRALEKLKVPFTGAYSFCYEPSRNKMANYCREKNILMPRALVIADLKNLTQEATQHMKYPMIVKHGNSFGSIGLIKESKVDNFKDLKIQTERMLQICKTVRIEEFIEGKEFSCLVSQNPKNIKNPIAYIPIEVEFPENESFKHANLKWVNHKQMNCKPVIDNELASRIKDMSKELFMSLNGRGYGRCDIRMDQDGNLFMLEINFQAGILYPPDNPGTADLILQLDPLGHKTFIDMLLRSAFINCSMNNSFFNNY